MKLRTLGQWTRQERGARAGEDEWGTEIILTLVGQAQRTEAHT